MINTHLESNLSNIAKATRTIMRNLIITLIALLLTGIVLSLVIPKVANTNNELTTPYNINQSSLYTPIPMKKFLLVTPIPSNAKFTLRLGLYSELSMAVETALSITTDNDLFIIKATDSTREWYLLLHGQYESRRKAERDATWLQNNNSSATLMLFPATD